MSIHMNISESIRDYLTAELDFKKAMAVIAIPNKEIRASQDTMLRAPGDPTSKA